MPGLHSRVVGDFLIKQGLLPKNCRKVEILMEPSDKGVILRYEVLLEAPDVEKIAAAFQGAADYVRGHSG
jgi:hypothetical protein